jgi:signal transduction histidine kinase
MALRDLSAGPPPTPLSGRGLLRLTAGLAHTVNNALTGTVGYLELALRRATAGSDQLVELRSALDCAHRAAEAVRQFITFATAPEHVHSVPVSLRDAAIVAAEAAKQRSNGNVTVTVIGDKPGRISGRLCLISTAVEQIVNNALEAMATGGRLTLEVEESGGRCKLWVRDTGAGVPSEIQAHLFEPFVTSKSFGHLGLGLTLASELVQALNGTLSLSSCSGVGTTVLFAFPALKTAEDDRKPPQRYPDNCLGIAPIRESEFRPELMTSADCSQTVGSLNFALHHSHRD